MNQKYNHLLAVIIIVLLGFVFHKNYINEFPSHIHAWAQSDRYALALGFVNNDLDFFKPETFVLNHQFPDNWMLPSEESITAVDFPVHDYMPAIIMKLANNSSPWIFRIYILLYSFLGLFFLFRLSLIISGNAGRSLAVLVFAASSPVFVYYQSGFLPSIPSLSNAIIGLYFYLKFIKDDRNKNFTLAIVFLSLATLSRTTFAIPLIAILTLEFLTILKRRSGLRPKLVPVLASLITILFFYFYNGFLRKEYGSIFLNHLMPPHDIQEVFEIVKLIKERWLFQYFSKIHYLLLFVSILSSAAVLALKKVRLNDDIKKTLLLIAVILLGCFAFTLLMLRQFPDHDYYFLDTFFLPAILIFTVALAIIPSSDRKIIKIIVNLAIILLSIPLILHARNSQDQRRQTGYWDRTAATIESFQSSAALLDSHNISRDSRILVIGTTAPNIPFILMQRKGYALMTTEKETINAAFRSAV